MIALKTGRQNAKAVSILSHVNECIVSKFQAVLVLIINSNSWLLGHGPAKNFGFPLDVTKKLVKGMKRGVR